MKKFSLYVLAGLLLALPLSCAKSNSQTSSARAAYGTPAPFSAHARKNKKAKRKAQKAGKRKKAKDPKQPYQRLPM
jgi:hypothetical protein